MATQYKGLVSDILQIISDYRGETTVNSDAMRIRAISRQEQDIANRRFWSMYLLPNQTMAGSGTNDQTIGSATYPMRTKGLTEVFVNGTDESHRYQIVDYNKYKNLVNRNSAEQVVYTWYDAANDLMKMHINPIPAVTDTITYSYYWTPPERTASTDAVSFVEPEALARLALSEIYESEEEDDKAIAQKSLAEQILEEATSVENAPSVNQTYSFGAIENSIKNQGIGMY
jgi:hypothetical protein